MAPPDVRRDAPRNPWILYYVTRRSCIVLGSNGLAGSAVGAALERDGFEVIGIRKDNYDGHVGASADALVNCNGNTYRFKAAADPAWDFSASVSTVVRSLFDFRVGFYVYISTIDVYSARNSRVSTREDTTVDSRALDPYAFHKWVAERLVERHAPRSIILRCGTVVGPTLKKGPLYDILHRRPVRMSVDSRLSLVDTAMIALAVEAALDGRFAHDIVNVSGTGSVTIDELGRMANVPLQVADDERGVLYEYDINNERLAAVMPVDSSKAIAARFIQDWTSVRT